MIKLLKWAILKEINTLKWIFIGLFVFLFILSIVPIKNNLEPNNIYSIFLIFSKHNNIYDYSIFYNYVSFNFINIRIETTILNLREEYSQPFIKILTIRLY